MSPSIRSRCMACIRVGKSVTYSLRDASSFVLLRLSILLRYAYQMNLNLWNEYTPKVAPLQPIASI